MLFFLDFARRAGLIVTGYDDEAEGEMHQGSDGKARITRITLRPKIVFGGEAPDGAVVDGASPQGARSLLHRQFGDLEIVIEPR
jgi:hypothetical protein